MNYFFSVKNYTLFLIIFLTANLFSGQNLKNNMFNIINDIYNQLKRNKSKINKPLFKESINAKENSIQSINLKKVIKQLLVAQLCNQKNRINSLDQLAISTTVFLLTKQHRIESMLEMHNSKRKNSLLKNLKQCLKFTSAILCCSLGLSIISLKRQLSACIKKISKLENLNLKNYKHLEDKLEEKINHTTTLLNQLKNEVDTDLKQLEKKTIDLEKQNTNLAQKNDILKTKHQEQSNLIKTTKQSIENIKAITNQQLHQANQNIEALSKELKTAQTLLKKSKTENSSQNKPTVTASTKNSIQPKKEQNTSIDTATLSSTSESKSFWELFTEALTTEIKKDSTQNSKQKAAQSGSTETVQQKKIPILQKRNCSDFQRPV